MIIEDRSFASACRDLPQGGRVMALDLGSKTIGIALSDTTRRIANPVATLARGKFTADANGLLAIAERETVAMILLGLPVNMNGSEGPRAQSTRAFARNLTRLTSIPLMFWDERLSTAAVERMLIDADQSRSRRAEVVDKLAAAWLLQSALDSIEHGERHGPT
jgi:putative Holliday junction resolvase